MIMVMIKDTSCVPIFVWDGVSSRKRKCRILDMLFNSQKEFNAVIMDYMSHGVW